jgi:hypothetical protein
MRILLALALLATLAACGPPDKYSKVPETSGPWRPANADPSSIDNNIIPNTGKADLQ